ncbi:hypothetical protein VN97_g13012, partial [Penicillium thymicola]
KEVIVCIVCLQRSSYYINPLWISLCIFLFFSPSLLFSFNALFHSKTWLVTGSSLI